MNKLAQVLHKDKIERIKSYYLEGQELDPADEETRLKLDLIFRLATADKAELAERGIRNRSKTEIKKYLVKLYEEEGLSDSHAYYLIRQAEKVFGWVNKVDKDGLRAMQTERYLQLYDKALNEGDLALANQVLLRIDSVNGLLEHDTKEIDIDKLFSLLKVNISTDPAVLKIPNDIEEAEEVADNE